MKRVLSECGIGAQEVPSGASAITLWHEALDLVVRRSVLRALIEAASEESQERAQSLAALLADVEPHLPGGRSPERLEQLATEGDAATSEVLGWPSTLPSGAAIIRPESQTIQQHLSDPEIALIVVLGEAGCGKSALLATVGHELRKAGSRVLGVRLDRLGKDVTTDEHLQHYLSLSEPLAEAVEALASQGPITVLIDQLDALCDLMTERAGRLALMLDTIERLASIENVHVVLASRPFEYNHDVRLRRVRAVEVTLALPAWSEVEPHIVALDVDPKLLPADLREELRRPQALRTFLELVGQGHDWRRLTLLR